MRTASKTFDMATLIKQRYAANEKNVEELLKQIRDWDKKLQICSPSITFLGQFITADIFQKDLPKFYEDLFTYSQMLTALKAEKIELHQAIINHKNDINGMLECEDVSCESFYYSEHKKMQNKLGEFLVDFNYFQEELFKYCTNKLRKSS